MKPYFLVFGLLAFAGLTGLDAAPGLAGRELKAQNEILFQQLKQDRGLTDEQIAAVRKIFNDSGYIGQGNPVVTKHPVTPAQCLAKVKQQGVVYDNPRFEKICGGKYLAPLYDPKTQKPEDATVCIDQFEFPDIPCVYPVTWAKAREAAEICTAVGERLPDADEWEGACDGELEPPDYDFAALKGLSPDAAIAKMRSLHNKADLPTARWSYGPKYETGICATGSSKTPGCNGGSWTGCGSNTYPDGDFPACHSPLDVYDQNGNAAETMNLPLNPDQMSANGSKTLGYTELKGSWFIFDTYRAHPDWCRWRAPFWHGSLVMAENSHANYHLSFRCAKTIK